MTYQSNKGIHMGTPLTVCVAYVYERLHEALDSDDLAEKISRLSDELAHNWEVDTGVKIGVALGWDKPTEPTEPAVQVFDPFETCDT